MYMLQNIPENTNNSAVLPIHTPLTVAVPPPGMAHADIFARNRVNMVNQYLQMSGTLVILISEEISTYLCITN